MRKCICPFIIYLFICSFVLSFRTKDLRKETDSESMVTIYFKLQYIFTKAVKDLREVTLT